MIIEIYPEICNALENKHFFLPNVSLNIFVITEINDGYVRESETENFHLEMFWLQDDVEDWPSKFLI